jgi:hypothetical protein
MKYGKSVWVGLAFLGLAALGCSAERDVEVSGKVTAPSTVTVGDKMVIDFIDVVGEGTDAKKTIAHTAALSTLGEFKETVPLEGDQVLVRVIDDRDGDGKCTAGEAWGETYAAVANDKAQATTLMLGTIACPVQTLDE